MNKNDEIPPRHLRRGMILALIGIPIFIGAIDLTVVSAVLPHVILDLEIPLRTGLDEAAWMITGYLLAYSISMTFMGRMSDLYGRRRVFLIALGIFAFGSYLVAVADTWPVRLVTQIYYFFGSGRLDLSYSTLYVLIAARMVQALGAGAMVPVGMAITGDLYPVGHRGAALGFIAAVDTLGWVFGHLYGGIIVRFWPWQSIFWFNLPVCLIAFLLIWFLLRNLPQTRTVGRLDWIGVLLLATFLTFVNMGLGEGTDVQAGLQTPAAASQNPALLISLSMVFLLLFLFQQRRSHSQLVNLSLFRAPNYLLACILNLLIGGILFITIANVPLFINSLVAKTVEESAWLSGWMLCAFTVPMALATVPGGRLSERFGYRLPILTGLSIAIIAFLLMRNWAIATSYLTMAAHLLRAGIGIGLTMAPIAAAILNASLPAELGTSSALVIIFRLIGMMVGVSATTSFGLKRAEVLTDQLSGQLADATGSILAGLRIMERVISETFTIAAFVAVAALIGALALKNENHQIPKEGKYEFESAIE